MVRSQNGRQQNFQLDHCVLSTHTTPGPGAERNKAVVVAILCAFRQKVVRIEGLRIRVDVFASMDLKGTDDHRAAGWQHILVRGQMHVFVELPSYNRNWWIHSKGLEDDAFQVLHFHAVRKSALAIG